MPKKKVVKWFEAGAKLGWRKEDSQAKRRAISLRNRDGNYLKAGRALQALANVTRDKRTAHLAKVDSSYFFAKHRLQMERTQKGRK